MLPVFCATSVDGLILDNDEFQRIWEGRGFELVEVISQNLPGGTEENHEQPQ
jgi:hypothetical protein